MSNAFALIAINVGNTRCQIGLVKDGHVDRQERFHNTDLGAIVPQVNAWWQEIASTPRAAIAMASVSDEHANRITSAIEDQCSVEVYRVGVDLPVPIGAQLDPETITGVDRLLNAAAAFDTLQQACIVVDAGTALTIDFVDGEGTFQGGAIGPGAQMQLDSLARATANLPELKFRRPDADAFGRSTAEAMLHGVFHGIRGAVQRLAETYAERYGAYPLVIATGGDAPMLFEGDELIDRIVPGLTLMGIAASARHALSADDADADVAR